MKKLLKWLAIVLGAIVVLIGGFALFIQIRGIPSYPTQKIDLKVDVTPERIEKGRKIVNLLCANCHYDQSTGRLSGKLMIDVPAVFGTVWSRNITQDKTFGIGGWTDGEIAFLLRTGIKRDGQYAPPWMVKLPLMADEDLHSIIAFLRSSDTLVQPIQIKDHEPQPTFFAKFLCLVAFKPYEYPTQQIGRPAITDKVAYGKYIATGEMACFGCHSADFQTNNDLHPEQSLGFMGGGTKMADASGRDIFTPNITMDKETGIGNWTEADFIKTLRTGIRANKTPLRYPMERTPDLTDEELSAVWAYMQTIPVLHNQRKQGTVATLAATASEGEKSYHKYACNTCHGDAGLGQCDLRQAFKKYKTNDELTAWIKDPSKTMPGSKMPTWDGVIQDSEYGPLCEFVRLLGERSMSVAAAN